MPACEHLCHDSINKDRGLEGYCSARFAILMKNSLSVITHAIAARFAGGSRSLTFTHDTWLDLTQAGNIIG
jgi:hypothetical protein